MWNWELDIEYPRAERGQDFTELGLRPGRAERTGAGTDHEHGLVPEHVRRDRARDPVDSILQLAGNGRVVLRCREQHRVRVCDRRIQARDALRTRMDIVVLVVRRNLLEAVVELELDVRAGGGLSRGAQQARVVRVAAKAAGDAQDPRHWRVWPPGFTNCSSARMATSFASAGSPLGSGLFQSTPKSVRSMVVVRLRPMRSFP